MKTIKRRRLTKRQSQAIHAKRRARSRYGVTLNRHQLKALIVAIAEGRSTFIRAQSLRTTIHDVPFTPPGKVDPVVLRVVYDKLRHQIVTCLPKPIEKALNHES